MYFLKKLVWKKTIWKFRGASGKDCDLSLAITGADTIPLAVVSLTWALTGAAIMVCYFLVDRKLAKKFLTAQTH